MHCLNAIGRYFEFLLKEHSLGNLNGFDVALLVRLYVSDLGRAHVLLTQIPFCGLHLHSWDNLLVVVPPILSCHISSISSSTIPPIRYALLPLHSMESSDTCASQSQVGTSQEAQVYRRHN